MRHLLLLTILLLMEGCATRKASMSVEQHTADQTQTDFYQEQGSRQKETTIQTTAADLSEAIRKTAQSQSNENMRMDVTLYDTARAKDSLTGKPPVLAEMTIQRDRQRTDRQQFESDLQASGRSDAETFTEQADSSRTELTATSSAESETKTDEKTKTARREPWWVWAVGLGVIVTGWMLFRKRF